MLRTLGGHLAALHRHATLARGLASAPARLDAAALNEEQDCITLSGMRFYAYHGVLPEEQRLGQQFHVDAVLHCGVAGLRDAGRSDDLQHTVSYADCYRCVRDVMQQRRRDLIEAVAEDIAAALLRRHGRLTAARVTVRKPHVAIDGHFDAMGVSIFRSREA